MILFGIIIFYPLFKPEHSLRELLVYMLCHIGIVRVGVVRIIELHNMKPAAIHIEMNIALFKIRRDRFPDLDLRMHLLYLAPRRIADTPAVNMRRNKQRLLEAPV